MAWAKWTAGVPRQLAQTTRPLQPRSRAAVRALSGGDFLQGRPRGGRLVPRRKTRRVGRLPRTEHNTPTVIRRFLPIPVACKAGSAILQGERSPRRSSLQARTVPTE